MTMRWSWRSAPANLRSPATYFEKGKSGQLLSGCRQPTKEKSEFLIYAVGARFYQPLAMRPIDRDRVPLDWPHREPSTVSGAGGVNQKLGFPPHLSEMWRQQKIVEDKVRPHS
jgi:hypothetical protein